MTRTHNLAARASVLALAAGAACVALGVGAAGVDGQSGQLARSCEREKQMAQYWDMKGRIGEIFLFDPSKVDHFYEVGRRHMEWASEACTSG